MRTANLLRPVQINDLAHINDIVELTNDDNECLNELKRVLEKHNKVSKFGVTLLHKHFDIESDEVLVETCDTEKRVLTAKVEKINSLMKPQLIETVWRFDGINGKSCSRYCPSGPNGHYGYSDHG